MVFVSDALIWSAICFSRCVLSSKLRSFRHIRYVRLLFPNHFRVLLPTFVHEVLLRQVTSHRLAALLCVTGFCFRLTTASRLHCAERSHEASFCLETSGLLCEKLGIRSKITLPRCKLAIRASWLSGQRRAIKYRFSPFIPFNTFICSFFFFFFPIFSFFYLRRLEQVNLIVYVSVESSTNSKKVFFRSFLFFFC